jgi:hypothetical protein
VPQSENEPRTFAFLKEKKTGGKNVVNAFMLRVCGVEGNPSTEIEGAV